jgi:CheY-like chemotaxis protein
MDSWTHSAGRPCGAIAESLGLAAPAGHGMDAPEPKAARTPSGDSPGAEWSLQSPPPEGITIENLRKRGFDLLRLRIRGASTWRWLMWPGVIAAALALSVGYSADHWLLGGALGVGLLIAAAVACRAAPGSWTITIVPDRLSIGRDRTAGSKSADTVLMFSEIQEIQIRKTAGGSRNALQVASSTATVTIGAGLSMQALEWLKNYLIMEVSGLTWRPIFDVGRRTTRKRSCGQTNMLQDRPELARKGRALFLEQAPRTMERLRAAIERKDPVGIKREAHWLKSSGANVGASHLSELCQLMEIHALNNDLSKVDLLGADIDKEFEKVQAWLNGIQQQDAPPGTFTAPPVSLPKYEIKGAPSAGSGTEVKTEPDKSATDAQPELAEAAPVESAAPAPSAPPLFDARVLLVEDSPINREVAAEFLRDLVSYVEFAGNGQQAVDAHLHGRFDLILMDCQMPEMDGFQATRLIRQRERNYELSPVPIVALTANSLRGDRDKCLAAGMDDYISKPFAPETLKATVEKWLGPERFLHRPSAGGARHVPGRAAVGGR